MQAATRMADGQWPWRDFGWAYGPGEPLVVMALGKALRPVAAVVARCCASPPTRPPRVLVWALVPRPAGPRWALAGLGRRRGHRRPADQREPHRARRSRSRSGAVLLATPRPPGVGGRRCAALAAFWRPDVGAIEDAYKPFEGIVAKVAPATK